MLCEKCKVREANIKYTEIINGVKTEHNLCSHCAKEIDFGQYTALLDGEQKQENSRWENCFPDF